MEWFYLKMRHKDSTDLTLNTPQNKIKNVCLVGHISIEVKGVEPDHKREVTLTNK